MNFLNPVNEIESTSEPIVSEKEVAKKKYNSMFNPDDPPIVSRDLDLPNPIQQQTKHRLRLMVFPKTKIPFVDLPHGMKNILYRS